MYAMALMFNLLLGWGFTESIVLAGVIVLISTALGGLSSSIGHGLFGGPQLNHDGSTLNKDLLWGAVMTLVGVVTLALAWYSPRRRAAARGNDERNG